MKKEKFTLYVKLLTSPDIVSVYKTEEGYEFSRTNPDHFVIWNWNDPNFRLEFENLPYQLVKGI